jgi:hypothetical protein
MKNTHNIVFISLYTFLFTILLFVWKEIFFSNSRSEEQYIEPVLGEYFSDLDQNNFYSFSGTTQGEVDTVVQKLIYESFKEKYNDHQKSKVFLRYIPTHFSWDIAYSYVPLVEVFLYKKDILSHINKLWVYLYKNKDITRGRMKWWNIHMYGVEQMSDSEFLWVLIHEFGHYYDIYSLPAVSFGDRSQDFYDISWESMSIMKQWSDKGDFVSGYGMTNQYEDFAESYVYYILHNEDFMYRSINNNVLAEKYRYIREYIFSKNQFLQEDFSDKRVEEYYWDVTKLDVDVKKFLQYLQEAI